MTNPKLAEHISRMRTYFLYLHKTLHVLVLLLRRGQCTNLPHNLPHAIFVTVLWGQPTHKS